LFDEQDADAAFLAEGLDRMADFGLVVVGLLGRGIEGVDEGSGDDEGSDDRGEEVGLKAGTGGAEPIREEVLGLIGGDGGVGSVLGGMLAGLGF